MPGMLAAVAGLLIGGGILSAAGGAELENLLRNPGFDNDSLEWNADVMPGGISWTVDSGTKRGESGQSLKISGQVETQELARLVQRSPGLTLKPGVKYTVSAWVRTEGAAQGCVLVKISGQYFGSRYKESPGAEFKKVETTFVCPEDARFHYAAIVFKGTSGAVWFDDVSFTEAPPKK